VRTVFALGSTLREQCSQSKHRSRRRATVRAWRDTRRPAAGT
jgi:hypothetical protein